MTAWEKEKAYCKRRGQELLIKMNQAIDNNNIAEFKELYTVSLRYLTKKERWPIYKKFLEKFKFGY